jgi:hypothetical protein
VRARSGRGRHARRASSPARRAAASRPRVQSRRSCSARRRLARSECWTSFAGKPLRRGLGTRAAAPPRMCRCKALLGRRRLLARVMLTYRRRRCSSTSSVRDRKAPREQAVLAARDEPAELEPLGWRRASEQSPAKSGNAGAHGRQHRVRPAPELRARRTALLPAARASRAGRRTSADA